MNSASSAGGGRLDLGGVPARGEKLIQLGGQRLGFLRPRDGGFRPAPGTPPHGSSTRQRPNREQIVTCVSFRRAHLSLFLLLFNSSTASLSVCTSLPAVWMRFSAAFNFARSLAPNAGCTAPSSRWDGGHRPSCRSGRARRRWCWRRRRRPSASSWPCRAGRRRRSRSSRGRSGLSR